MATVREAVLEAITKSLSTEPENVTPEAHFQNDLGADSLDLVEMVMDVETVIGIDIPDDAQKEILTVGQLFDYLANRGIDLDDEMKKK